MEVIQLKEFTLIFFALFFVDSCYNYSNIHGHTNQIREISNSFWIALIPYYSTIYPLPNFIRKKHYNLDFSFTTTERTFSSLTINS